MNDRCTPAAARRLKELGFPQPVPAPGQVWYSANEMLFFLVAKADGQLFFCTVHGAAFGAADNLQKCAYAPTAPDILRELGQDYRISYFPFRGGWVCEAAFPEVYANETNPAEACAEAWEVKQKAQ